MKNMDNILLAIFTSSEIVNIERFEDCMTSMLVRKTSFKMPSGKNLKMIYDE